MMDLVVRNAKVWTGDAAQPQASAIGVRGDRVVVVGDDASVMAQAGEAKVIDANRRRMIPGLHDSHTHLIRGGLNYTLELRWDGVRSLADAMAMLREQVARTPAPQWVRVVGGFSEHQFVEKRLPTLAEINAIAPDTPVFILHLYDRALLNAAALRAAGYTRDSQDPPGGSIERDKAGNPTGLLLAKPNALILYATLAKGPKLPVEWQTNSTRHFMRELNRLGITSVIDAGGGFQNYPEDYEVIQSLHRDDALTVRIAYNLFTQNRGGELGDFRRWSDMVSPGAGDDFLRHNGAGEMLVFSAADFEDFREPRPELAASMEDQLEAVATLLVDKRWPFRIHATYDESITRILDAFERVHKRRPFEGLRFTIDHAETISDRNIDRVVALGGGIAIQHRMAYQGEYFVDRYGREKASRAPPLGAMLAAGVPVGAGTDATRVASYNPWVALAWMTTGRTLGGMALYDDDNRLDRDTALSLWTQGSAWFANAEKTRGRLSPGQLADFSLLSSDYFDVPDDAISRIESVLTVVGGRVVHGAGDFEKMAPVLPPPMPEWSPVRRHGGYQGARDPAVAAQVAHAAHAHCATHPHAHAAHFDAPSHDPLGFWGPLGCSCFAF
ncbi:amidohydrolase [Lysobacter sp. A6]|uniref:Amidohydrolase n=1 Tax=Noviluteimonas lactosilytica TaxID=2888523 RepID=A0ABS8JJD1_9GAMM|nr:amidohydrolase [Lysobacter lactosilyticus]MCC8363704.1 amidohydrolase [Lysobacter lactosilyticus]